MKRRVATSVFLLSTLLIACAGNAPAPTPTAATQWRATLVTATGTNVPGAISGVSERFTFEGRIHAHATLVAETPVVPSTTMFTMKWFNGSKLVHERSASHTLNASPYYLVHAIPGSVLGAGSCRVELHSASGRIASREFTVAER